MGLHRRWRCEVVEKKEFRELSISAADFVMFGWVGLVGMGGLVWCDVRGWTRDDLRRRETVSFSTSSLKCRGKFLDITSSGRRSMKTNQRLERVHDGDGGIRSLVWTWDSLRLFAVCNLLMCFRLRRSPIELDEWHTSAFGHVPDGDEEIGELNGPSFSITGFGDRYAKNFLYAFEVDKVHRSRRWGHTFQAPYFFSGESGG